MEHHHVGGAVGLGVERALDPKGSFVGDVAQPSATRPLPQLELETGRPPAHRRN